MATAARELTNKALKSGIPPQATDAERAVLSAMMRDSDAAAQVIEILKPTDYYHPGHRKVFESTLRLFERNEPIDVQTVAGELERTNDLENCGGRAGLIDILESSFTAANAGAHAQIIQEKSVLRQLITTARGITEQCTQAPGDVSDLLDDAEAKIFAIAEARLHRGFVGVGDILPQTFESIEEYQRKGGGITGLATGFTELDALTAGFHKSDLIILAGRPSMGKTALALNMIEHVAVEEKKACAFFSLEMSKEQLVERMLCSRARVNAHLMRTGRLRPAQFSALSIAVGPLSEAPIFIDDSANIGILELRAKARRLKAQHDVGMVVVDYMQMMHASRSVENRQQEISIISRSLKSLAKELQVPVLALSQLSRQVEQRGGDRRPQLSDLRESGAIEQDADVVMFVYRAERYDITQDKAGNPLENVAEIIVGKQRNGPTGSARLTFLKDYARFENMARERGSAPMPGPGSEMGDETPF